MTKTQTVVAILVGVSILLTFLAHVTRRSYRFARSVEDAIGPDREGKTLRENVEDLKAALDQGLSREVRVAIEAAAEARRLAGQAAMRTDLTAQKVEEVQRGVNAVRAELDIYARVVANDTADLWTTLHDAGLDRRRTGDTDDG